jgi:hypothetical protein
MSWSEVRTANNSDIATRRVPVLVADALAEGS